MKPMPSALSTSSAYSISRRVPSTSGIGTLAKSPKRPGCARHFRAVVVADARHLPRGLRFAEPDAGCRDRQHRLCDAVAVHVVDRAIDIPGALLELGGRAS